MTRLPRRSLGALTSALGATLVFASTVHAQPLGEGPLVLRLPASARALSMGNAAIASNDGDAMFYNPGMLANSRGSAVSLQRYGANGTAGAMATTSTSGSNTIGIGVQFVSYGAPAGASYADVVQSGGSHLVDKGPVSATSTALTLGFARTIKGQRIGVSAKYAEDQIGGAHDGTVAFDIGANRQIGPGTLGVVVQNLGVGPRVAGLKGTLPRRIGVGYGGTQSIAPQWDLGAQMALTLEGDLFVRPAGGAELGFVPIDGVAIVLRGGFRLPREQDESLVTAGLGFTLDRWSFDYAMEPMRGGRPVSHRLGIRLR